MKNKKEILYFGVIILLIIILGFLLSRGSSNQSQTDNGALKEINISQENFNFYYHLPAYLNYHNHEYWNEKIIEGEYCNYEGKVNESCPSTDIFDLFSIISL